MTRKEDVALKVGAALTKALGEAGEKVREGVRNMLEEEGGRLVVDDDSFCDMLSDSMVGVGDAVFDVLKSEGVERIG